MGNIYLVTSGSFISGNDTAIRAQAFLSTGLNPMILKMDLLSTFSTVTEVNFSLEILGWTTLYVP